MTLLICPECRGHVSDAAPSCPRCGVPAERIRGLIRERSDAQARSSFVLVGVVIAALLFVGLCTGINSWRDKRAQGRAEKLAQAERQATAEAEAAARRRADEDAARERIAALARLNSGQKYQSPQHLVADCDRIDSAVFPPSVKEACGNAHVELARALIGKGHLNEARAAVNSAARELGDPAVLNVRRTLSAAEATEQKRRDVEDRKRRAQEAKEERQRRQAEQTAGAAARRAYGEALRERFLNDNLDIKVSVTGNNASRITLTFVLFNDVWRHKFAKGDLVEEMGRLGFKRVDMKDGYDYHYYWTFD